MISMPFADAFVSGSLSALASGTEVAITFASAAIAALMPGDLLRDVVVRVDLRDADAAALEVLRGLVDALLEHRPERAGVAVRDDRDLDRRAGATRARMPSAGAPSIVEAGGREAALDEQAAPREPLDSSSSTSLRLVLVPSVSSCRV